MFILLKSHVLFENIINNKFVKNNLYYLTTQVNKLNWFFEISNFIKCYQYNFNETDFSISEYTYFNEFNNNLSLQFDIHEDKLVEELIELKTQMGLFKKDFDLSSLCLHKLNNFKIEDPIIELDVDINLENEDINLYENLYNFKELITLNKLNDFNERPFIKKIENILNVTNTDNYYNNILIEYNEDNYENVGNVGLDNINYKFENSLNNINFEDESDLEVDEDRQLDLKYKQHTYFLKNRDMLSQRLNISNKNTKKFSKMIRNLIKKPTLTFLNKFELSLISILQRSNFFFNSVDTKFFIKAGFVFVNGLVIKNLMYTTKLNDRINIILDDDYFSYYKESLHNMNILISRYSNYNFSVNQKKIDLSKQQKTHQPSWLKNLFYFREDIPNFLEIDFLTLSISIIYLPNITEYDTLNLRCLNIFQKRLYNWKFVN